MLRESILYHTRNCTEPVERVQKARELLRLMGEARLASQTWQPMIEAEVGLMLNGDPGWFYHDDLSPLNDAFYIRDFAARAAGHGLQYLGDAEAHLMFD